MDSERSGHGGGRVVDRRDFVSLTLGVAAAAAAHVGAAHAGDALAAGAAPRSAQAGGAGHATAQFSAASWRDALIINALGDLDDPNPPVGEQPGQRPAVQAAQSLVLNDRAVRDALAQA